MLSACPSALTCPVCRAGLSASLGAAVPGAECSRCQVLPWACQAALSGGRAAPPGKARDSCFHKTMKTKTLISSLNCCSTFYCFQMNQKLLRNHEETFYVNTRLRNPIGQHRARVPVWTRAVCWLCRPLLSRAKYTRALRGLRPEPALQLVTLQVAQVVPVAGRGAALSPWRAGDRTGKLCPGPAVFCYINITHN